MLEDLDIISQPIIDAILENLVEPAKTEKPAAYALARRVLQRCTTELHDPLYHFLQSCLPSAVVPVIESDLRDEWPQLVLEVRHRRLLACANSRGTGFQRPFRHYVGSFSGDLRIARARPIPSAPIDGAGQHG